MSAPFSAIHLKNEVGEETSKKKLKILLLLKHLLHLILPLQVLHQLKVKDCSNHSKDRFTGETKRRRRRRRKVQQQQQQQEEESAKHIESSQSDATISDNEKQNDTQNENLMNTVETSHQKMLMMK